MKVFEFESVADSYPNILRYVHQNGYEVSPRGMLTKEISPATIVIHNPRKRVIDHPLRKLNYGFMVGELFWILQGKNDLSITHYNKQWANYTDDGEILNGAYGQRIFNWDGGFGLEDFSADKFQILNDVTVEQAEFPTLSGVHEIRINQFMEVYKRLSADPDSRQGTIVLFDPSKDFQPTKDVPCTNLMRFSIRNGKLNMMVVMRSNDLWFGYPYDVFNFTMLQEIMAGMLGVEVGKYTHTVDSLHLYEMHFEQAQKLYQSGHINIYNEHEVIDARLPEGELNASTIRSFNIEHVTRENGDVVSIDNILNELDNIYNDYWRSLAATIAAYNLKKSKRQPEEIDRIKNVIQSEFKYLLK